MKCPSSISAEGSARLNLTPLIDVIFNLIIFFLAAAHFAQSQGTTPVDLPIADPRPEATESPRRLTVTVTPGPHYFVSGEEQPLAVVEAMIQTEAADDPSALELRIRSDRTVVFSKIEPLMLAAAKAGVTNLKFPVAPNG